jgi:drug/metabolite transporter (DMT)-like permease
VTDTAEDSTSESHLDVPGAVAALVTVVLWASAFISIRATTDHVAPGALTLGRMIVAALALVAILWWRGEGLPSRAAWPGILASGLLWFGVYMVALNWAEQKVDAGTAALVIGIGPLLIALLSGWFLKEGFPTRLMAGMAVSFLGAAIVGIAASDSTDSSTSGVVLCLIAAAGFAGGVVSQKFALRHSTPLQTTTFGCVVALIATAPFAGQLVDDLGEAPASAGWNVVYLGLFPTALAFTTWAFALSRVTAGKLGATTYAVPALTVLMSWVVLSELPSALAVVGGVLCLTGVAVARSKRAVRLRRAAVAPAPSLSRG